MHIWRRAKIGADIEDADGDSTTAKPLTTVARTTMRKITMTLIIIYS